MSIKPVSLSDQRVNSLLRQEVIIRRKQSPIHHFNPVKIVEVTA